MPTSEYWRIQLFGTLRLTSGERTVTRFRTQMTGSLLAYLAYHGGRPQPREVLIDMLWPDAAPKAGRGRLSIALSSLRSQLASADQSAELIVADSFTVGLNTARFETDTAAFTGALTRAARASSPIERIALLEEAVDHYGSDLLVGYYDAWVVPEQERLRERFLNAVAELVRLREQGGEPGRAVVVARRAIETDPLREESWCDLIRLLAASGEPEEAQRCYREMKERFAREDCVPTGRAVALVRSLPEATIESTVVPKLDNLAPNPPAVEGRPYGIPWIPGTATVLLTEGEEDGLEKVRIAARRSGGTEIPAPEGAARFLFSTVPAALSTAVEGAGVRSALDTGVIERVPGGYDGTTLRTLPRLLGAAHPGQTLCTEATAALARRPSAEEPSPVRLRDLGIYRIVEGDIPERLFQAEAAHLPPVLFPPLRIAAGYASTLPPASTRFFGRTEEVTRIRAQLTSGSGAASLITLTGLGGVGKTRLALEAAAGVREAFQGRIWFVPLADLRDPERIPGAIRDVLRLPADAARDPLEQAASFLSEAPSLLILDNLEQLTAGGGAALVLRTLREQTPSLVCLITSRQMIGVEGERALPVGPLPLPYHDPSYGLEPLQENACVQLFVDRARASRPDFAINATNAPSVSRLCTVLEGIPLALELAAARVSLLSPTQMLAQIESRFALLRSRRHDLPERHRSLWAAVDSSYQLLRPDLQRLFAHLSVFRGVWTLEAAETVCAFRSPASLRNPLDLLESLTELQECSLIVVADTSGATGSGESVPRFRMLETLREFAAERLREWGEAETARERHRAFFADLIATAETHLSAGGDAQQEWLNRLEADLDNLRAALDHSTDPLSALRTATALHRFWLIRGHAAEGRHRLNALLAAAPDAPEIDRATARNAAGVLAWASGALDEAEQCFLESLNLYRACAGPAEAARSLNNLGIVSSRRGNFARARVSFEESLALYRALGDTLRLSMVLTNLGGVLVYLKDYDNARAAMEESLPIQRAAADSFSVLRTLQNLAEVACRQGDIERAAIALRESLALRRSSGDRSTFWDALATAAHIACGWRRLTEAAVLVGAVEAARASAAADQTPAEAEYNRQMLSLLASSLSEEQWGSLREEGRATSFDRAVEIAERLLAEGPSERT
jgi:non-specific serine/threonine protein kinase